MIGYSLSVLGDLFKRSHRGGVSCGHSSTLAQQRAVQEEITHTVGRNTNAPPRLGFSLNAEIPEHEQIHLRAQKAVERFFRITNDRFVFVERRVQHHRDAG